VVIVPDGARVGTSPVIVEAKGVSPTYFPLTLENLTAPEMMGELGSRFIYVIPTYRGERLEFDGKTFTSEGNRTDALDGATDDAIAFLSVALETTSKADPNRICVFGRSRGGTVALLTGIRDKRVDCVVNWSGPTDWFHLMDTDGWTEQEMWAEALRMRATPTEPGGQNVERFLSKAIAGKADLAATRHNIIASSPVYFAARLPLSQHHYGLEDPFVPSVNGYRLIDEVKRHRVAPSRFEAFFYPDQGHDTDRLEAPVKSRRFIAAALGVK
jgi:acetyl esterase/lipase